MTDARLNNLNIDAPVIKVNRLYSILVKVLRIGLPLAALALIFIVVALPKMEEDLVILPKEELITEPKNKIGKNELLNPKFETIDANNNPLNITAERAIYSQENPNLVTLEIPHATLKSNKGENVVIDAAMGTYEQQTKKLFLKDDIKINHESGYTLLAEELRLDIEAKEVFSDKAVEIDGPGANVKAIGLEAHIDDGTLLFKGPAKLIIKSSPDNLKTDKGNKE